MLYLAKAELLKLPAVEVFQKHLWGQAFCPSTFHHAHAAEQKIISLWFYYRVLLLIVWKNQQQNSALCNLLDRKSRDLDDT